VVGGGVGALFVGCWCGGWEWGGGGGGGGLGIADLRLMTRIFRWEMRWEAEAIAMIHELRTPPLFVFVFYYYYY